jgi:hypothetical protein
VLVSDVRLVPVLRTCSTGESVTIANRNNPTR